MRFAEYRRRAPHRTVAAVIFWWIIVRSMVRIAFRLVYRQRCLGRENIPGEGPVIYVSNHQSHYDPPIVGSLVGPFASLARSGLFKFKPFAWLIRGLGAVPLELGKGDTAAIRAAIQELDGGGRILIFPEGGRTRDGTMDRFAPGVILMVKRSGAPVMPISLEGAYDVWPITRRFPRLTGRLAVKGGPVIAADELLAVPAKQALERLRREIEAMRLELRAELRELTRDRYPAAGAGDEPYWEREA